MRVEKPAAYMGGELHSYDKEEESVDLNFGFCFPDTYEIGMSYLGLQIIYHVLNERENIFCQRFVLAGDMERLMREKDLPLFSIEKKQPAREMDILGFTLQYELSFTKIPDIVARSGGNPAEEQRTGERRIPSSLPAATVPLIRNPWPISSTSLCRETEKMFSSKSPRR